MSVSVGLKANDLDPEEVTRLVGVQPTRAVKRGVLLPKRTVPSPWGIWVFESRSDDVTKAATEILCALEPRMEQLREASSKYDAEVNVGISWQPEGGQGGYSLPADTLRRLSALASRIDFYFS